MPESCALNAGPLEAAFRDGVLSHVRFRGFEVIERIYGAVRDSNWGTPQGTIGNLSVHETPGGFRVDFDSVHREREIDFRWHGTIIGTESGRLSFEMDGKAYSTFARNRIGLCVHHPLRECAGRPCLIETADGRVEHRRFPEFVAPSQPLTNIRAMTYDVGSVSTELRFTGDAFETEDHRNWTDANFKTYGTPLSLPFPVQVLAGSSIRQAIDVSLNATAPTINPAPDRLVRVRATGSVGRLPRIGLALPAAGRPLSEVERAALRRLRLSHLRVDIALRRDCRPVLERAAAEARSLGTKLEIAAMLPGDTAALAGWSPLAERWLVYREDRPWSGASEASALRAAVGPHAVVAVGTNANFAELNRNRPDGQGWDAACFSINPQVHVFDDESVMANAAAQGDAVRSARHFLSGRPVVVSPVTLRPQFNPVATGACEPPEPDPRQRLPFGAAWTMASLKALIEAGASSVTYYHTHGPGGVLDGNECYPVFRVLEAIGEVAGADAVLCESSDPGRIAALAFDSLAGRRYLIANLTPGPSEVELETAEVRVLEPYEVACVDQPPR